MQSRKIPTTFLFLVALTTTAIAQTRIHDLPGTAPGNEYGRSVAIVEDVNNDGHDDFIVGIPLDDTLNTDAGLVHMISGRTGAILWTRGGLGGSGNQWGYCVAAAGDTNNDGTPDVIVGAPFADTNGTDNGRVEVLSGSNGSNLSTHDGNNSGDQFGLCVCGVGDVNNDGRDDYAIGAPGNDPIGTDSGQIQVISGFGGFTIWFFNGNVANGGLGTSLAGGFDANDDGGPDLVAGAPGANYVRVYALDNASLLFQTNGTGGFGTAVAGLADVSGDGRDEIAVGAPSFAGSSGRISIRSGLNGIQLGSVVGPGIGARLGAALGSLGDFDGNGTPDLVAGAPGNGPAGPPATARIYSGVGLGLVATVSEAAGSEFGLAAAGGGDVNADGLPDAIVGAPFAVPTGKAVVIGYTPWPGTDEDLRLEASINGGDFTNQPVRSAAAFSVLQLRLTPPGGSFSGAPPLVLVDLFATVAGTPGGASGTLPGLQSSVVASLFLLDGTNQVFGLAQLGTGWTSLPQSVPMGLNGLSVLAQGFSISPGADNGAFAATDALEFQL